jgi:uncharacterized protein (TIGR02246 family)
MKKMTRYTLLSALFVAAAFINPLKAQDAKKELTTFVKNFQDAYNKKDDKALKEMYTKDATRTMTDGKVQNGNEEIRISFADFLKENTVTIKIKLDKVVEKDGITTMMGTYHVTGTSSKGEKVDRNGAFTNTVVKENGKWKISKSVLTALKA